jgi:protein-S-isoprenylcysteine O-methyltransferase Ste14
VDVLLSFAAALVSLRLAGPLARARRYAWAAGLVSFAAACAAMAWGAAHSWDAPAFRVYYLAGALLSAPLLGLGSLSLAGKRWAGPLGLAYTGLAIGIAAAMPVHGSFAGTNVPRAQDHVDTLPRVVAIAGSSLGALAVIVVAVVTLRRRPLGNALIVAAVFALFLDLKSRREEAWLRAQYPAYAEYARQTKRLVPYVY